jgi:hypothetical protein
LGWTKTLCFGYISGGNAAGLILWSQLNWLF